MRQKHAMPVMHDPFLDDVLDESPYFPAIETIATATDLLHIGVPEDKQEAAGDKESLLQKLNNSATTVREVLPLIETRYKWLLAWLNMDKTEGATGRVWPSTSLFEDSHGGADLDMMAAEKDDWERRIREAIVVVERELGWGAMAAAEAAAEAAAMA